MKKPCVPDLYVLDETSETLGADVHKAVSIVPGEV